MVFIREQTVVRKFLIAICAFTGFALTALPARAQTIGSANNKTGETVQTYDGTVDHATVSEHVFDDNTNGKVSDAKLKLRSEGDEYTIEFSDVPRRRVVERLFATSGG